jgi:UrcA family protein
MNTVTTKSPRTRAALYTLMSACVVLGACATVQAGETCTAAAQSADGARAVNVSDLNLSTAEGASVLYARINHAAHKVCDAGDIRNLDAMAAGHACERAAVAQAVRAVHSPQLAALVNVKLPQG